MLQLHHEWVILANLFLLLMGFAILSRHFERAESLTRCPHFCQTVGAAAWFCLLLYS
jgi:hypothetical protein